MKIADWHAHQAILHLELPEPRLARDSMPLADKGAFAPLVSRCEEYDVASLHVDAIEAVYCDVATVQCYCT